MDTDNATNEMLIAHIQELEQRIRELEAREEISDLLLQKPNSLAIKMNVNGIITFMNDYSRIFFGGNTDFVGKPFLGTLIPDISDMRGPYSDTLKDVIDDPESYMTFEAKAITPEDTDNTWIEWTFRAFSDIDFNVSEIICIGNDVSRNKQIENELKKAATTDLVTGLMARNSFVESFEREEYRFNRYGQSFSMIFASVSNYQDCFEEFAADYIDTQMKILADIILESLRLSDIACRWSAEEFIVMLPETDMAGAERAAGKIQFSLQKAIDDLKCEIPFALLFGAIQFESDTTLDSIVSKALDAFDDLLATGDKNTKVITL